MAASLNLQKFKLYETRARFYLVGTDRSERFFRVLKFDRTTPSDLNITEDLSVYPLPELRNLLQRLDDGNHASGGLTLVTKVYGIVGCVKFLESYYLILVTKQRLMGTICGHEIFGIDESRMIPIPHSSVQTYVARSTNELRYKKLLSGVDLRKDFFFSYTYPIMQSLQENVLAEGERFAMKYENRFVWNAFLSQTIRSRCKNTTWAIPLVHGYFEQIMVSAFGREISLCLISRRSRFFAGTRYLKRGVNDLGHVANDVETEQIVMDEVGKVSSVVQLRGSIPLFWSQATSKFSPKPDIMLHRFDPLYEATRLHFEDLAKRYGAPTIVLTLVKTMEKRPREMILRQQFYNAVRYLNQVVFSDENRLHYIHKDFQKVLRSKHGDVLEVLSGVANDALDMTGFYYSRKSAITNRRIVGTNSSLGYQRSSTRVGLKGYVHETELFQNGVLRTNCIDCLDRTNVAQYAYGLEALGRQLHTMGFTEKPKVDPDSCIVQALKGMYHRMGDALAYQYGGSAAHNTVFSEGQGEWKGATQLRDFLTSVQRFYSNAYTDAEKQAAINLFLGKFQPQEGKPALWELESDYHLHVSVIGDHDQDHNLGPEKDSTNDVLHVAVGRNLPPPPIPSCKDFSWTKLTSLEGKIHTSRKNVRLYAEPDQRTGPYAMEIQSKICNSAPKIGQQEYPNGGFLRDDEDENRKVNKYHAQLCPG